MRAGIIRDGDIYRVAHAGLRNSGLMMIGGATSPNGLSWTKDSTNPVLVNGPGECAIDGIEDANQIQLGAVYYLTYSGRNKDQD